MQLVPPFLVENREPALTDTSRGLSRPGSAVGTLVLVPAGLSLRGAVWDGAVLWGCGEMLSPSQPIPAQPLPWGSCMCAVLGSVLYALLSESLWEKTDCKLSPVPSWIDSKSRGHREMWQHPFWTNWDQWAGGRSGVLHPFRPAANAWSHNVVAGTNH